MALVRHAFAYAIHPDSPTFVPDHTLNGAGIIGVAQGLRGLAVHILAFPLSYRAGNARPNNYFDVGLVRVGNQYGWSAARPIDAVDLWLPTDEDTLRFGYNVFSGGTITVDEIPAVPLTVERAAPFDRNLAAWSSGNFVTLTGNSVWTTLFTYTVPAGRILALEHGSIAFLRNAVSGAVGMHQIQFTIGGNGGLYLIGYSNTLEPERQQLSGGTIYLPAGTVIQSSAWSNEAGVNAYVTAAATGYLFDQ